MIINYIDVCCWENYININSDLEKLCVEDIHGKGREAITMKPTSPPRPYIIGDDSKVNEKGQIYRNHLEISNSIF